VNCRHCGAENNDQARFCQNCGKGLAPEPRICIACHVSNSPDARFCTGCGASLEAAGGTPGRATQYPVISAPAPAPPVPKPPLTPRADPVPGHSAGNKVAAICIWIVCAVMAVVALTAGGPTQDELRACIAAGGSGSCASYTLWSKVFLVLSFFGTGLGGRFWMRR
jgi:hypothetical protein